MPEPTLQQLMDQVQSLTRRVAHLEQELGLRNRAAKVATEPDWKEAEQVEEPAPLEQPAPVSVPAAGPGADLETRVGLRLVNRVVAVTLILGVAFFFKYAIDNQWIGETARVLLGMAAGLALLAVGEIFFRRSQAIFAQGITGTGAAIVYLSFYAAFRAYGLIPVSVAFALMAGTTALAAYLAMRYDARSVAVLALFGGFAAPFF